ncbi:MAG: ABC transporter ATP-binding protein/permease [Actinomycetota bacterium]|nr:ABC transporter ATP-binding protein/permease [Actinomycetota bacterium]
MAALVGNGLAQAGAAVATALLVEHVFSAVLVPGGSPTGMQVASVSAGLAAAVCASAWLRGREQVDAERLGQAYVHELRIILFEKLTSSSARAVQQRSQGATSLRFIGDITALRRWVSLGLARLVVAGTMISGALTVLAVISPALAAVIGVVLMVGGAVSLFVGARLRIASRAARRRRSHLAANVTEKIGAVAVVQAFGQQDHERHRVRRQSKKLRRAMVERARVTGHLRSVTEGTAGIASAAVVIAGMTGGASTGTVAGAMTIVGLLVLPLRDLGRVQEYWHNAEVSKGKIEEFLARPTRLEVLEGAGELRPGEGRIAFEQVRLDDVLHGISVTAAPGQTVAIVGPNGAGKTTLLSLAARLLDADGGRILIDGHDLMEHDAVAVRRLLGLVGPDLPLLRGTVGRNLLYRWPEAPQEEVDRVSALCGLGEVVAELSEGLETKIAEDGASLSAGQRQRLALARALVGDPPILLLDEADANLDRTAAGVVDRVLEGHDGTVLIVTHQRHRVEAADVVWHLRNGRLVETGPPQEVLNSDTHTARLFSPRIGVHQ